MLLFCALPNKAQEEWLQLTIGEYPEKQGGVLEPEKMGKVERSETRHGESGPGDVQAQKKGGNHIRGC